MQEKHTKLSETYICTYLTSLTAAGAAVHITEEKL